MSEGTSKIEKNQQETKAAELSQQELDKVAGGDCASPKRYPTTGGEVTSEIVVTKPL